MAVALRDRLSLMADPARIGPGIAPGVNTRNRGDCLAEAVSLEPQALARPAALSRASSPIRTPNRESSAAGQTEAAMFCLWRRFSDSERHRSTTVYDMPQQTTYYREAQLVGRTATAAREALPGILPFSHTTLWRLVRAGTFPKPIKLADRITAWRAEDVDAWLRSRASVAA